MDRLQLDYLARDEAIALLGVKPATLYAYVSRGLIRSLPAEDRKSSLYARADVERLRKRKHERPSHAVLTETSSGWGMPILRSGITRIGRSGPIYRGHAATTLVRHGYSYEAVAELMFTGILPDKDHRWAEVPTGPGIAEMVDGFLRRSSGRETAITLSALALLLELEESALANPEPDPRKIAHLLIQMVAGCLCWLANRPFSPREDGEAIGAYALRAAGAPVSALRVRALEGALIALADNVLAPATYAARILASTGVGLNGCISAALCSNESAGLGQVFLVGEAMAEELLSAPLEDERTIRDYASRMLANQLNKRGDGRVTLLLDLTRAVSGHSLVNAFGALERIRQHTGVQPNLNVALGLLAHALKLPKGSTSLVWTLGRMAGWCAHIIEQAEQSGAGSGNKPAERLIR